jgi:eukaryotic-like serine/threonine-protein kinase
MGSVWAARNELTDRDFAVKFLHPKLADNKEALHRFFLEARACGQIKHPAVVDVYDMGQAEDGSPYLVMEMLEGEGFDQRLARAGCFRPSEAAAWIAFIARGLEEAHVRGLVHRDLKPGNIFFALDDRGDVIPKILDFGVSKATSPRDADFVKTSTGAVLGSPAYMSPEQARGDLDIDGRSDVWSLGVILYECLTGKAPFDAPNYNALMLAIITRPHRPVAEVAPGVPLELSQLVDVTLAKEASGRVRTARELADRLEAIASRITESPIQIMGLRTPTLMGGQTPVPRSTTQNTWSDGRKTTGRRSSAPVLIAAGLLSTALLDGAAVAFVQLRAPTVAVAGRSHAALQTALTRLGGQMDQLRADALAAQKVKDQQIMRAAVEPGDLPAAKGSGSDGSAPPRSVATLPASTGAPSSTAKVAPLKPHKADPQSAVPGPGF